MIRLIEFLKFAINYLEKFERQLVQIQCVVSDRNRILEEIILDAPFRHQKYLAWRAYRFAVLGCPLDRIVDKLNLMKGYLK